MSNSPSRRRSKSRRKILRLLSSNPAPLISDSDLEEINRKIDELTQGDFAGYIVRKGEAKRKKKPAS